MLQLITAPLSLLLVRVCSVAPEDYAALTAAPGAVTGGLLLVFGSDKPVSAPLATGVCMATMCRITLCMPGQNRTLWLAAL